MAIHLNQGRAFIRETVKRRTLVTLEELQRTTAQVSESALQKLNVLEKMAKSIERNSRVV